MKARNNRPLSDYKVKKILWHFVVDVTAAQTAKLLKINRNTVNRYYNIFINGIESFRSFTKRRLKKFNGVKVNFERHLKECEFRWRKSNETMYNILKQNLKKGLC